jgi:hypothetical protein
MMNQTYILACYFIYIKRKNDFCLLSIFQADQNEIWKKETNLHWWRLLWYNDACKWWLRLKHIIYGTELKNIIERFIQQIKDRTECFDDHFPCRIKKCDRQHVRNWLKMFILFLEMNTDRIKFTIFLLDGG